MDIKDSEIFKIYLVKVDMRILRHFADYILENGEEVYASLSPNIKMALKIALVVCYARPFIENYKSELNDELKVVDYLAKDFLDEEKVIHKRILEMYFKEIGNKEFQLPKLEDIESNIVHISLPKSDSEPLDFKIVNTLRVMAKKVFNVAKDLVEDSQDFDQAFRLKGAHEQR